MTGRLLTARNVAEILGVNTETVLRLIREGQLPAIRLPGGRLRIVEAEFEDWLASRATSGSGVLATKPDATRGGPYPAGVGSPTLAATRPRPTVATEDQES
ncbi:MAG: helix-turn-helix domain-containing protein [Solirubrobacteraceae bacterium]